MKKFSVIICIIISLCTAICGWYIYNRLKTSPTYSLRQAGIALKNNDKNNIEKYIDLNCALNNIANLFIQEGIKQGVMLDNGEIAILLSIKSSIVSVMKDVLLQTIDYANKHNNIEENIKIKKVKTIKQQDDNALVELIIDTPEKQNIRFVLEMHRNGNYWKVKKLMNPQENILEWMKKDIQNAETNKKQKDKDNIYNELLSIMGSIAAAEERYRLVSYNNNTYTTRFEDFDIEFTDVFGDIATGSSFDTKNATIKLYGTNVDDGKVIVVIHKEHPCQLTRYYRTGKIECADTDNITCNTLGI